MFSLIFRGLATGSIYSLTAVGIVLILSTTNVMNFAQGDVGMFLTYIAFLFIARNVPPYLTLPVVVVAGILLGVVLDRGLMIRARRSSHLGMVMITLALTMILEGIVATFFGTIPLYFPPIAQGDPLIIGSVIMDRQNILTIGVALLIFLILFIILYRTKIGIAARSIADDEYGATILGVPINRITTFIWALSFGIAGIAGLMTAPRLSLEPSFMIVVQLKAFIAAVLGGMGSITGAIFGGLILGVLENFIAYYIPSIKESFSLILVVVVLLFLPNGIFGRREARRA
jgi:branched-chain amino acid transport system permease protein